MNKLLLVCADDYGQNSAINQGILGLAGNKRINAISCLANMGTWTEAAAQVVPCAHSVYVGLHFNLTYGYALSKAWQRAYGECFPTLQHLIRRAYLGGLSANIIDAELRAQCDAFSRSIGFQPDYIDGHQHVHQLPVVRQVLLKLSQAYHFPVRQTVSISTANLFKGFPKRHVIAALGGLTLKKLLVRAQIPTNTTFAGLYDFTKAQQYARWFNFFLAHSADGGIIMCHPGLESNDVKDPLKQSRPYEWSYLNSEQYLRDLACYQITLAQKKHHP